MGGDEFMLILEQADTWEKIREVAELICKWMDEPVVTPCEVYRFSASIGIARWPEDARELEALYRRADQAMYQIKHNTRESGYLLWKPQ
jgi:diguanylate cyclase (GGDEF)-like protein